MTTFTDPVAVLRAATTQATAAPTTRILDAAFTTGPMPLAHVHLLNTGPTDDVDLRHHPHRPPPGRRHRARGASAVRPG